MTHFDLKTMLFMCVLFLGWEQASAQFCRVSMSGATQNRKVTNVVYAECPGDPISCWPFFGDHSVPFGNWGATSNFGQKQDGHQFQGWCHDHMMLVEGEWKEVCEDDWYEWNSCTVYPYNAPNCTLFNADSCYTQQSNRGVNIHGTTGFDAWADCPRDTDGDGSCDEGGCLYHEWIGTSNNYMSLYEIDPCDEDELVQSVYFPSTSVETTCDIWGCAVGSSPWVSPTFYQDPSYQVVFAEMALVYNGAYFVDPYGACADLAQYDYSYNCW